MRILGFAMWSALAIACGGGKGGGAGGTGIPEDTLIVDLTPQQAMDACEYFIELQGPPRTIDCNGEPLELGIPDSEVANAIAECTAGIQTEVMPGCTATIGDGEACFEALSALTDAQLCDPNTPQPAACSAIFDDPLCG